MMFEEDPFLVDPRPAAASMAAQALKLIENGDPERGGKKPGKSWKAQERLLVAKSIEHYRSRGYLVVRADRTVSTGYGSVHTEDFLGFGDLLAFTRCGMGTQVIAIQSTTLAKYRTHILKICHPDHKIKAGKTMDLMREWFASNGKLHFALWSQEKPGAKWEMTTVEFTRQMADEECEKIKQRAAKRQVGNAR